MKIRPLHKTIVGSYVSNNKEYLFVRTSDKEWYAYKYINGRTYLDTPYYYNPFPTLKSLINALESK